MKKYDMRGWSAYGASHLFLFISTISHIASIYLDKSTFLCLTGQITVITNVV